MYNALKRLTSLVTIAMEVCVCASSSPLTPTHPLTHI